MVIHLRGNKIRSARLCTCEANRLLIYPQQLQLRKVNNSQGQWKQHGTAETKSQVPDFQWYTPKIATETLHVENHWEETLVSQILNTPTHAGAVKRLAFWEDPQNWNVIIRHMAIWHFWFLIYNTTQQLRPTTTLLIYLIYNYICNYPQKWTIKPRSSWSHLKSLCRCDVYFFLPGHHFLLEVKFDPIDEGVQIQIGPSRPYWVIHYGCSANGETGQKLTQVFARLCMTIYYKHYTINIMTKHVDITLPILILEPTLEHPVGGINIVEPMTWG